MGAASTAWIKERRGLRMKAQIHHVRPFWRLIYYRPSNQGLKAETKDYLFFDGAVHELNRIIQRINREQKAYKKLPLIRKQLLSAKEFDLISKLEQRNCRNITVKQYGWLTGIIERQYLQLY